MERSLLHQQLKRETMRVGGVRRRVSATKLRQACSLPEGMVLLLLLVLVATVSGSTVPPPNGPGFMLGFDGVNDYLPSSPAAIPSGNSPYTIEAWIRPNTMHVGAIAAWGNYGNDNQVNAFVLTTEGLVNYWWANDVTALTTNLAGAWHHVAATFDGVTRSILLDGVVIKNDTPGGHNAGSGNFRIGLANTGQYFAGSIDEVRIWNLRRTATQIQADMRRQLVGTETGLVVYYRFDEGDGLNAFDATGDAGNTATLSNGPVWLSSTLQPFAPTVVSLPAIPSPTTARLRGLLVNNNSPSGFWFDWGNSTNYGNVTSPQVTGAGLNSILWSNTVSGLVPGSIYHYRAVATNAFGTSFSSDRLFGFGRTHLVVNADDSGLGSLREALAEASDGDVIEFAASVGPVLSVNSGELVIDKNLNLRGPGATLLTITTAATNRLFRIPGGRVRFSGLTFAGGRAFGEAGSDGTFQSSEGGAGGQGTGGGLLNFGDLTAVDCLFTANFARGGRGGNGSPGDEGDGLLGGAGGAACGGAIFNSNRLTLRNCTFATNWCIGGLGGTGGNVTQSLSGHGGVGGRGGSAFGGAIYNAGVLVMTNCTFYTNAAAAGGGGQGGTGIGARGGSGGDGGSGGGGGILDDGYSTLVSCTLHANQHSGGTPGAGGPGASAGIGGFARMGGFGQRTFTNAPAYLRNTIIAGNRSNPTLGFTSAAHDVCCNFISGGFNFVGVVGDSVAIIGLPGPTDLFGQPPMSIEAQLGPFGYYGGTTPVLPLQANSPALDQGHSSGVTTDQRGFLRSVDDPAIANATGGDGSDIGAVERSRGMAFLVLNTNDAGANSLRQAIADANTNPGADTIAFAIPGAGQHTVVPLTPLPTISDTVLIDGYSQSGASVNTLAVGNNGALLIELSGANAETNPNGLTITSSNCTVRGLVINRFQTGIYLNGGASNELAGNFIGTDANGTNALGNGEGIVIGGGRSHRIGGPTPSARNVISANRGIGVWVFTADSSNNLIQGNLIGTSASGSAPLGNELGVSVQGAQNNLIGGLTAGNGNVIAFNHSAGINIIATGLNTANGNAILGNSIFANQTLGIDLNADGITPNEPGDVDTGPNRLQNFPVLTGASFGSRPVLHGALHSAAATSFRLEFFASSAADASGYGEGQTFLAATNLSTDGSGDVVFTSVMPEAITAGKFITATATDPAGNTSEFSQAVRVAGEFRLSVTGGGEVTPLPAQPAYAFGQSVTLRATPKTNYQFVGWSDGYPDATRLVTIGETNDFRALFTNTVPLETLVFKQWERSYGGSDWEGVNCIVPTPDGGFLLGGPSYSGISGNKATPNNGQSDTWIVRLDAEGNKIWERDLGSTNSEAVLQIVPTGDGSYLLAGYVGPDDSFDSNSDYWIAKITLAGEVLWERTFGGSKSDALIDAVRTSDGSFILVGSSSSPSDGSKTAPAYGGSDYWVVKVDAAGNKLWDRSFGTTGDDVARAVIEAGDGGALVFGDAQSGVSPSKPNAGFGATDYWAIRLDSDGNTLWERIYGGNGAEEGIGGAATVDGGFLLVGQSASGNSGNRTEASFGNSDYWAVRTDSHGEKLWDRAWGGLDFDAAYRVLLDSDGGAVLGGISASGPGGNKVSPHYGGTDLWLVGVDAYGNRRWDYALGGSEDEYGSVPLLTQDGALVVAGWSGSSADGNKQSSGFGEQDMWMVKLATREAPVGTPALLVDGLFYPANSVAISNSALLEFRTSFSNGLIFYTLDGSDPDAGALYTGPFRVSHSATVRAVAYTDDLSGASEAEPFTLIVQSLPVIVSQPQSQTRAAGTTTMLTVAAVGPAPLRYQWHFNGASLPGDTNAALVLNNLQAAQAGAYVVVVVNLFGAATSAVALLQVVAPPGLLAAPASTNVAPGMMVSFSAVGTGGPPLLYQWRKNGVNIFGATNAVLVIASAQISDGGTYDVVVANAVGAVVSPPAVLTVTTPLLAPGDNLAAAVPITNRFLSGCINGSNVGATHETGEPDHGGKHGSNSVWYSWNAPATGIVSLRTSGSPIDTLLSVYTGTDFSNLLEVSRDEDRGGFVTSAGRFNASLGVNYLIAVDGFAGEQGAFVLCWELEPTSETLPEILVQPASATRMAGESLLLSTLATGNGLSYQWHHNGQAVPGATGASLTLSNLQLGQVGFYSVGVTNGFGRGLESEVAIIEMGADRAVRSVDKFQDLPNATAGGAFFSRAGFTVAEAVSSGVLVLRAGTLGSQSFYDPGLTQTAEPTHCGLITHLTRWFVLQSETDGVASLDTLGSGVPTIVAVYLPGSVAVPNLNNLVTCAPNNAPDGVASLLQFPIKARTNYWVVVDAIDGAVGVITLNWSTGVPTTFPESPAERTVRRGGKISLSLPNTNEVAGLSYQWFQDERLLNGATRSTITLTNVQRAEEGTYSIRLNSALTNLYGPVAYLRVDGDEVNLVQNSFETGPEGWGTTADATALSHFTVGGNPAGYISARARNTNVWYWSSPAAFPTNLSAAYGGWLEFDLRRSAPTPFLPVAPLVSLNTPGLTVAFHATNLPGTSWTSFKIRLDERVAGWRVGGMPASQAQLIRVLENLTNLRICGLFASNALSSTVELDNVALVAVCTGDAPRLTGKVLAGPQAPQLLLQWQGSPACFQLQSTADLAAPVWQAVTTRLTTSATNSSVLSDFTVPQRFFRLVIP